MIVSEMVFPAFSHILDEQYRLCEQAKDGGNKDDLYSACQRLWLTLDAMSKLTSCFKEGGVATNIATSNERRRAAEYIEGAVGVNPISDHSFAYWLNGCGD